MTLLSIFSRLEDPRSGPAKRYGLSEIIVMAICAVVCGADDWVRTSSNRVSGNGLAASSAL